MGKPRVVTLVRRCKTPEGWRRFKAAISANGRVIADTVIDDDGKSVVFAEGTYQLRSYERGKTVYVNVGNNTLDAKKALDAAQRNARGMAEAKLAGIEVVDAEPGKITLETYLTQCVDETEVVREAPVMAKALHSAGKEFLAGLRKGITPQEITGKHLQDHLVALSARGLSKRTVENRFPLVKKLLVFAGVNMTKDLKKIKPPKSEKKVVEYYTKEQRDAFMAACRNPREHMIFGLALKLGLREQELMYLEPWEFNYETKTVTLHSKTKDGFAIKDKEERTLPVPNDLLEEVKAYVKAHPKLRWLTSKDGAIDGHLLRLAKRIGRRAGLTCRVILHKFRATYATTLLRNKVDVKTVQMLMGHADLESTLKYLRAIEAEEVELQSVVNAIDW